MNRVILIFAVCLTVAAAHSTDKKVICYYASWATYRSSIGKYDIADINATLCTHLIYSFIGLRADGTINILDPWIDVDSNGFKNFVAIKESHPSVKTMVAMGGWNEGSKNYSTVMADSKLRTKLADNIVEFLQKYCFDGFDLDWEYPVRREGGRPSDKENLVLFLKELYIKLKKLDLLLSIAVSPTESAANISYNIPEISNNVDFINLMTYEFHGTSESEDGKIGHNTPLYRVKSETGEKSQLNINSCVNYWISQGAKAEKIILGTAFYGITFTLKYSNVVGRGAPFTGPGTAGKYTKSSGTLAYYEVCDLIQNQNWTVIFDDKQRVPYAYSKNQIVAYDDVCSLKEKAVYAKRKGLGGCMMWSIDYDDHHGTCGEKDPLLKILNKVLRNLK